MQIQTKCGANYRQRLVCNRKASAVLIQKFAFESRYCRAALYLNKDTPTYKPENEQLELTGLP